MTTGFTNGCYDILHVGHIKLFKYLKSKCDHVTIGIDSDLRVKSLKGKDRPFNNQQDRKLMLESLEAVDRALIFDSEEELIEITGYVKGLVQKHLSRF